jgi:hypothetical protein
MAAGNTSTGPHERESKMARPRAAHRLLVDAVCLSATVLIPFSVYLCTLYPGVGGGGDAAKFQFLGRVLGTAHPPGYPLYVMVSHVFGWLPIGSLAYRINLMSAVAAALTAGVMYLASRGLGAGWLAAAASSLGLAFGRMFWSKAVGAEVYALGGLLVGASLLGMVAWDRRRTPGYLLLAVAAAAAAFGNHLTSVGAIPGYIAFVLLTDGRQALRPRVLLAASGIVVLGVAQYGFIVLRTLQGAAYLEARATTAAELWQVITARRYAGDILAFNWTHVLTERVPEQARLMAAELGPIGMLWLTIGVLALVAHRRRVAVLLAGGAAGLWAVALTVAADTEGFLLPVLVPLCPIVAVGIDTTSRALMSRARALVPAVALLALLSPAWLAARNYRVNDHSRRYVETWYLDALFDRLPAKALIVSENYATDQLVNYKLLGEGAAGDRDIRLVAPDIMTIQPLMQAGFTLYAFPSGRGILQQAGLRFEPVPLMGPPLHEWLAALGPGWTIAAAGSGGTVRSMPPRTVNAVRALGDQPGVGAGRTDAFALVGSVGRLNGGTWRQADGNAEIVVPAGQRIGSSGATLPEPLKVQGTAWRASVELGGRVVATADGGLAIAVIGPAGQLIEAQAVLPGNGFRVPFAMTALPLYEARAGPRCLAVGNAGWQDVTSVLSGLEILLRIDNYRPYRSTAVLYLVGDAQLDPRAGPVDGTGTPEVTTRVFNLASPDDRKALFARLRSEHAPVPEVLPATGRVARVAFAIDDRGESASVPFSLASSISRAFARVQVDLDNPRRALVCGEPAGPSKRP